MPPKCLPLKSLLIKATGPDCNLNCTYCFYLQKAELFPEAPLHRMSDAVQEELIRQAMRQSDQEISFAWQGGEPTLIGLDFYRRAIVLEQKYGHGQLKCLKLLLYYWYKLQGYRYFQGKVCKMPRKRDKSAPMNIFQVPLVLFINKEYKLCQIAEQID